MSAERPAGKVSVLGRLSHRRWSVVCAISTPLPLRLSRRRWAAPSRRGVQDHTPAAGAGAGAAETGAGTDGAGTGTSGAAQPASQRVSAARAPRCEVICMFERGSWKPGPHRIRALAARWASDHRAHRATVQSGFAQGALRQPGPGPAARLGRGAAARVAAPVQRRSPDPWSR